MVFCCFFSKMFYWIDKLCIMILLQLERNYFCILSSSTCSICGPSLCCRFWESREECSSGVYKNKVWLEVKTWGWYGEAFQNNELHMFLLTSEKALRLAFSSLRDSMHVWSLGWVVRSCYLKTWWVGDELDRGRFWTTSGWNIS